LYKVAKHKNKQTYAEERISKTEVSWIDVQKTEKKTLTNAVDKPQPAAEPHIAALSLPHSAVRKKTRRAKVRKHQLR